MTPPLKTLERARATASRAGLFAFLLTALALMGLPSAASAVGPTFSLSPIDAPAGRAYFVYESKAAKKLSGRMRVLNTGDAAGVVSLYAVDATTGQTSGAVYRSRRDARREVGSWTRIAKHRLRLAPGQAAEVGFRVRVPRGTKAGEHLGGFVAENRTLQRAKTASRQKGRFKINVRGLSVVALQVNVPGPRVHKLLIDGAKAGGSRGGNQMVLLGLRNDGNTMVKPTLAVQVKDGGGRVLQRRKLKLDTFLPHTRIDYPVPVRKKALRSGSYSASVVLDDGLGHIIRADKNFKISTKQVKQVFGKDSKLAQESGRSLTSYLPWALLLLIAGFFAFKHLRGRRHGGAGPGGSPPPTGPDENGTPGGEMAQGEREPAAT